MRTAFIYYFDYKYRLTEPASMFGYYLMPPEVKLIVNRNKCRKLRLIKLTAGGFDREAPPHSQYRAAKLSTLPMYSYGILA